MIALDAGHKNNNPYINSAINFFCCREIFLTAEILCGREIFLWGKTREFEKKSPNPREYFPARIFPRKNISPREYFPLQ